MAATPSPDALPGLAVLEQTPIIIEKIVWAASDEQLHWKPAPDRWSISEVLAHLADVEVAGFRERIQNDARTKKSRARRLRSKRRLRRRPLLLRQSARKSEKILPRARPQPFRVALRSSRRPRDAPASMPRSAPSPSAN